MLIERPKSAFWGQSFVAELIRISAHGEKKLKLRRASMARPAAQTEVHPPAVDRGKLETNGDKESTETVRDGVKEGEAEAATNEAIRPSTAPQ